MASPNSNPPPALPFPQPTDLLTSPGFAVARPTAADLDGMADIFVDAFSQDPANTYWWSPDKKAQWDFLRRRLRNKMADPNIRYFAVFDRASAAPQDGSNGAAGAAKADGHGQLVAFSRWDIPERSAKAFGEPYVVFEAGAEDAAQQGGFDYPEGADPELCRNFFGALGEMSKKWNAASMLGLSLLATSPQYFRRGAAKALLAPMLAIADAEGLQTYLEATTGGRPVYEKLGFRQVDALRFDLAQVMPGRGRDGEVVELSIMIREPQGKVAVAAAGP